MIPELRKLGLTLYEIKVYRALLEHGQLDAKTIASESGVPPTAVYPALQQLREKGLIQQFQGEIRMYEPIEPSLTIPSFIEKRKKSLGVLQEELLQQSAALYHSKQIVKERDVLSITHGKEMSAAVYHQALKKVQQTYYSLGWHFSHIGDKYTYLQDFKAALRRGVDVRIIITGNYNKNWTIIRAYQQAGIKMRYLPMENFSIFIADGKECKITLKPADLGKRFNVHILDPSFAKAMNIYFLEMWKRALKI